MADQDYFIVEASGQPSLNQVMVIMVDVSGKTAEEIAALLSSLPSEAAGGSIAVAQDASSAWIKGLDGAWSQIGSVSNIPPGGTAGQFLKKLSSTDYDMDWASLANATQSDAGLMSAEDKKKLDDLNFYMDSDGDLCQAD